MICFPNLGLELEQVRSGISFLGMEITWFGILAGIGLLVMVTITAFEVSWTRQDMNEYANCILLGAVGALIGARGGYILLRWNDYSGDIRRMFQIRDGGLMFYGAVLVAVLVVSLYGLVRKLSGGTLLDTCCIGITAGQAIAAWGLFFNREGFGDYTNGRFAMQIPVDLISSSAITDKMKQHIVMSEGQRMVQVTPLFIWGFIWCIMMIAILFLWRMRKQFEGEVFLGYLLLYSLGEVIQEGKRTDTVFFPGTEWKIVQVLAIFCVILSSLLIIYGRSQSDKARFRRMKEKEARKFSKTYIKRFYIK